MKGSSDVDSLHEMKRMRKKSVEFLIRSSHLLRAPLIVKYTGLFLFADRFLPSLTTLINQRNQIGSWLLRSVEESNLQLFALISIWISSKKHDSLALSVKCFKSLRDEFIKDQHFTTRDFVEAEVVFLKVLNFEIGTSNVAFIFLEELFVQFNGVAKVGELVSFEACMDVMDFLYENEETSLLFSSPYSLAAAILACFRSSKISPINVTSYVITVPKQQWEFPVLPWVKFATSYKEEDIGEKVKDILMHVFEPHS
ncbi:Cyclin-J18 [Hibiscus syriacus]|uniref:Cyclin-J18 n=1 Tax=Hibiscus syriacus TaxID=106335 RepID=A0A6A2WMK0_HIBSY|nr:Cyclin-J18 [Hibiscus syriacus]